MAKVLKSPTGLDANPAGYGRYTFWVSNIIVVSTVVSNLCPKTPRATIKASNTPRVDKNSLFLFFLLALLIKIPKQVPTKDKIKRAQRVFSTPSFLPPPFSSFSDFTGLSVQCLVTWWLTQVFRGGSAVVPENNGLAGRYDAFIPRG